MADRSEDYEERTSKLVFLILDSAISSSLKKITDETYGICETCGEPIEEDRLAANPAARTCKAHMQ